MAENENRPGFLHLLGVEGLNTNAVRPVPVFGTDSPEEALVVVDTKMTLGHFVVYPKRNATKVTAEEKLTWEANRNPQSRFHQEARVVGKITKNREPQRAVTTRQGHIVVPPVLGADRTVVSGQAAFYVASNELRERFTLFSKETLSLSDLDDDDSPFPVLGRMATLVTIVDEAIHARQAGMMLDAREYEHLENLGERNFEVVASFRQFVTIGMPRTEIDEYTIYSEHGEYPVEVPRDVEMGMLLRMDKQVRLDPPEIKRTMTRAERQKRLLEKLKGV